MGLDTVELVMKVEEHFQLVIPDSVASTLVTVGLLHCWIVADLNRQRRPTDAERVYSELRDLICEQFGIEANWVVSEARFVQDLQAD